MAHLKTAILIIGVLNLASCISGEFLCRCEALKWLWCSGCVRVLRNEGDALQPQEENKQNNTGVYYSQESTAKTGRWPAPGNHGLLGEKGVFPSRLASGCCWLLAVALKLKPQSYRPRDQWVTHCQPAAAGEKCVFPARLVSSCWRLLIVTVALVTCRLSRPPHFAWRPLTSPQTPTNYLPSGSKTVKKSDTNWKQSKLPFKIKDVPFEMC